MDWARYKQLADTPGVWSRWMLEQTLELLRHPQLNAQETDIEDILLQLQTCLSQAPIPKPADHKGGSSLDMFRLSLPSEHAQTLLAIVQRACALGLETSGTKKRGLGGFAAAWQEYLTAIDLTHRSTN